MVDLGDEKSVRARNLDIKRHAALRANTLSTILQHRNGREFIYWLLEQTQLNTNAFDSNALRMAFKAGQQNIGQILLAELTTRENIDLYMQMIREANEDERPEPSDRLD